MNYSEEQKERIGSTWKNGEAPLQCIVECDISCSWCMVTHCTACKWFDDGWPGKVEQEKDTHNETEKNS